MHMIDNDYNVYCLYRFQAQRSFQIYFMTMTMKLTMKNDK